MINYFHRLPSELPSHSQSKNHSIFEMRLYHIFYYTWPQQSDIKASICIIHAFSCPAVICSQFACKANVTRNMFDAKTPHAIFNYLKVTLFHHIHHSLKSLHSFISSQSKLDGRRHAPSRLCFFMFSLMGSQWLSGSTLSVHLHILRFNI